jgi:small-conductance mechanosensitive channel
MDTISQWIQENIGLGEPTVTRLLWSLAVIVGLWLVRRVLLAILWRRIEDVRIRYRWRKTVTYVLVPLAMLVVGRIWWEGMGSIATFLGLFSAGLAIALKDLVVNLAGWAFILWRRPFDVGDRVQIGDHAGDVIDLRIFQFTLLEIGNWVDADQSTGRIIHIPNGQVLSDTLANFTRGFDYIWNELPVLVTFESDWRRAKTLLGEIAQRHAAHLTDEAKAKIREVSRRFMIFYTTLTPTVYTSVADSGVLLTIRYLCSPRQRRGTAEAIWEEVLEAFAQEDGIDFAYPTYRYYDNRLEGKPGTRPPDSASSPPASRPA